MIDLTIKALPNVIEIGGNAFSIYTDFRVWMKFEIAVQKMNSTDTIDVSYLFKNDMPRFIDINKLLEFSRPKRILPRAVGKTSNARAVDFEIDSDLIYASFMQAYGIDLTTIEDLHWHKFLALLWGLPENTIMHNVMSYRLYVKDSRKNVDHYEELREAWELEDFKTEQDNEALEEFNRLFGGG